jgi:periplasmic protein TonB
MEPIAMLSADPLDILFENRNKSYGAYQLRKYYNRRLSVSMGIMLSLVILSSFVYLYFRSGAGATMIRDGNPDDPHLTFVEIAPPVRPVPPPAAHPAFRPPATIEFRTPVIVSDPITPKPLATIEELNKNVIGLTTTEGTPDNYGTQNNGNPGAGTGLKEVDSAETEPEILRWAEVMPEFPGGMEALKRYLQKNLRMPENDLEPGVRIRVMARFIVDRDGRVRNIEITEPADAVFNVEVKRVISKMPDWKPGIQNNRHVAVYFNLPVNFVNAE